MAVDQEFIEFKGAEYGSVVAAMDELRSRGDGEGWVNIGPALSDEEMASVPVRSGLAAWFSGRGPAIPLGTWTPAITSGRIRPAQVGLAHGTGPDGLRRLESDGTPLPSGWTKRQDHAKHGIVAELPGDVDHKQVIEWIVKAATELAVVVVAREHWAAVVHRPR